MRSCCVATWRGRGRRGRAAVAGGRARRLVAASAVRRSRAACRPSALAAGACSSAVASRRHRAFFHPPAAEHAHGALTGSRSPRRRRRGRRWWSTSLREPLSRPHMPPTPAGARSIEVWLAACSGPPAPTAALFSVDRDGRADVGYPRLRIDATFRQVLVDRPSRRAARGACRRPGDP